MQTQLRPNDATEAGEGVSTLGSGRFLSAQRVRGGRRTVRRRGFARRRRSAPRQLRDSRFVQDVARSLERSGLKPTNLSPEITEGAVMVDVETATRRLHALRELGVSLAIDDVGTGHSSLALLRRLPMDTIKIDKMFVDTIAVDSTAASFLETIVQMAEILSLLVTVEGIETADQAALIATFGNVYGQGYQLGRPVGVAATDRLLADGLASMRAQAAHSRGALRQRPRLLTLAPSTPDSATPRAG